MDDIATKFEYLKETKNLIKQAIIDKGITVSDTDTFRSYADKISNITVGETINNQNKTITENGTYSADEGYTGLGEVVVDVATEGQEIPLGFTQYEYLDKTSGTGYLDLNFKATNNTKVKLKFMLLSYNGTNASGLFGYYSTSATERYAITVHSTTSSTPRALGIMLGSTSYAYVNDGLNVIYEVQMSKDGFYVNGTKVSEVATSEDYTTPNICQLYKSNNYPNTSFARVYSLKVYESGKLIHDFVPVKRNDIGRTGLFDKISGVFNAVSTETGFSLGNPIETTTTVPSPVATDDVCRKNLCYWMDAIEHSGVIDIDGTVNTNSWWSKIGFNYFTPYNGSATTPWNNDNVTLSSSYHGLKETTPMMYSMVSNIKEITYEMTFNVNSYTTDVNFILGNLQAGGSGILYDTSGVFNLAYFPDGTQVWWVPDYRLHKAELNQKVYVCGRIKQGSLSLYSTCSGVITNKEFTETLKLLLTAPMTVGYNGSSTGAYESQQANINVNSFRIYNRYITDEEMLANCKYEVDRFNIPEYRILVANPNVEGATVTLTANGYTQTDNYIKVLKGTEVTYSVSADGYTTQTGTITVNDTQTIDITL